jgi:putative addiction module component (TIGR02574 family)
MTQAAEDILKQALQLPPEDRLTLAQGLWDSVEPERHPVIDLDDELIAEIERRDAEIESGLVTPLTHEELMASVRKALECRRATILASTEK